MRVPAPPLAAGLRRGQEFPRSREIPFRTQPMIYSKTRVTVSSGASPRTEGTSALGLPLRDTATLAVLWGRIARVRSQAAFVPSADFVCLSSDGRPAFAFFIPG